MARAEEGNEGGRYKERLLEGFLALISREAFLRKSDSAREGWDPALVWIGLAAVLRRYPAIQPYSITKTTPPWFQPCIHRHPMFSAVFFSLAKKAACSELFGNDSGRKYPLRHSSRSRRRRYLPIESRQEAPS
ncbi:hypothetical protein VTH06DRAFT_2281 [Thermothelomyces fergusii]